MQHHTSEQARTPARHHVYDTAIGPGRDCLKANAKRTRVAARNPARAALAALLRHEYDVARARNLDMHVAVYAGDGGAMPVALFAIAGAVGMPELRLLYARTLPADSPLLSAGGPLDRARVRRELPRAVRRRAERRLGANGVREVMSEAFWQREFSFYAGTAAVLTALGFPMTPGVFVAGGLLLLIQGAARLAWQEARLGLLRYRIARDEGQQPALRAVAARRVFAKAHGLDSDLAPAMLHKRVLIGDVAVPDMRGAEPMHLLVDEDARIAVGGLPLASVDGPGDPTAPEDIPYGQNVVTIVFRARAAARPDGAANATTDGSHDGSATAAGRAAERAAPRTTLPARVDISDIGSARGESVEDLEIIDAELLDPDVGSGRGGGTFA